MSRLRRSLLDIQKSPAISPISLNRKPAYRCLKRRLPVGHHCRAKVASASHYSSQTSTIASIISPHSTLDRSFKRSPVCSRQSPFKTPSIFWIDLSEPNKIVALWNPANRSPIGRALAWFSAGSACAKSAFCARSSLVTSQSFYPHWVA
jgi:hypothetical protein